MSSPQVRFASRRGPPTSRRWARYLLSVLGAFAFGSLAIVGACSNTEGLSGGGDAPPDGATPGQDVVTIEGGGSLEDGGPLNDADPGCVVPPADPAFLSDAIQIDTSGPFICALRQSGQVVCWGQNDRGQLGSEPPDAGGPDSGPGIGNASRPIIVSGIPKAQYIATGYKHACAIVANGEVWCWGNGEKGQTGSDGSGPPPGLTQVITESGSTFTNAIALTAGGAFTCALTQGGGVQCWGENNLNQLGGTSFFPYSPFPVPVPNLGVSSMISAGFFHACALVNGPSVRCWGDTKNGALGVPPPTDGGPSGSPAITYAAGGTTTVRVAASSPDTCVIDTSGNAICSGYNSSGQLGKTGESGQINSPFPIPELSSSDVTDVDVGMSHTCGTRKDKTAFCLSGLALESLGRGPIDASTPDYAARSVLGPGTGTDLLSPVASVKVGAMTYGSPGHSCALVKPACAPAGQVYCWGKNENGEVGDGTTTPRDRPVKVLAPL